MRLLAFGTYDARLHPRVKVLLEGLRARGHDVIEVDLSGTTFLDCGGLGALIALRNATRDRKGRMRLLNPTPPVEQVLNLLEAQRVFEIVTARPGC